MLFELPVIEADEPANLNGSVKAWRSLSELDRDDAFLTLNQGEFAPSAASPATPSNRRDFLKIMGASAAFAGLSACRRPAEKILPYTRKPEEIIPGKSLFYASGYPFSGVLQPVLVESTDGRPVKIEPNPDHPSASTGTGGYAQASILNLYDPDRSKMVLRNGAPVRWEDFVDFVRTLPSSLNVGVIARPSSSDTRARIRSLLEQRFANVTWATWDAAQSSGTVEGTTMAYGRPLRPHHHFDQASVIVSFDAAFLGGANPNVAGDTASYAAGRRVMSTDDPMSRLYVIESTYSTTGGLADHRLRLKPSEISAFACAVAAALGVDEAREAGAPFADHPWTGALADDLRSAGNSALLLAGSSQPPVVHALCARMNALLGAVGASVTYLETGETDDPSSATDLATITEMMQAGEVDLLLSLDTNPAYDSPGDIPFAEATGSVETVVHVGPWMDETAGLSNWHIPLSMWLEAWGDGRAFDGTRTVMQPLIAPLYESKSEIEVMGLLATGSDRSDYELVRETWRELLTGDFEEQWRKTVHDGFLPDSGYEAVVQDARPVAPEALLAISPGAADEIECLFMVDDKVYDGTFSNNAWMQEAPDSVTKVTWDNVAIMSPATREALGLRWSIVKANHRVSTVNLSVGGRTVTLPVWELPGHADNVVTVAIGYGRTLKTDRVFDSKPFWVVDSDVYNRNREPLGNGVGTNVAALRPTASPFVARSIEVTDTGDLYTISSTQDHPSMEGRPIVRMGSIQTYREQPSFAADMVPPLEGGEPWDEYPTLWDHDDPYDQPHTQENPYFNNQWGLAIDLNTCTGCNACVIACQSENNIAVVGKEQVGMGRELSWMRIDRYFYGDDRDNPGMITQPMMCQHCEDAPCESVCPVAATVHSPDGLNVMVYNRCIGTRYCANNCPYKVRRYNYLDWTSEMPVSVQMAQNPNVTVRFLGVMEKCQLCVQRIREANIVARAEDRSIADGEVQTACQQVCPADAITFGDLNDPDSEVVAWKGNDRNYELLPELNVKPRASYLARLRNPNPVLEDANA